jgi:hypothetical protein
MICAYLGRLAGPERYAVVRLAGDGQLEIGRDSGRYAYLAPVHMARHAAVADGLLCVTSAAQQVAEWTAAETKKASRSLVTPRFDTANSW